jgi:RecJ-like exonuclease
MSKYYCPCCFGHHAEGTEHCKAFSHIPSLEGIEVDEKCIVCEGWDVWGTEGSGEVDDGGSEFRDREFYPCIKCNGKGTITRQATKDEIEEAMDIAKEKKLEFHLKSGGRLRIRRTEILSVSSSAKGVIHETF